MPRKKKDHSIEPVGPELETKANESLAEDMLVLQQHDRHLAEIDNDFGNGLPYDRYRIENECRFYLQRSADAMLEVGNRLLQLKEHESHGSFLEALGGIGIAPRPAQKLMQAAVKYSGSTRLLADTLNKTKLLELISEDDEDLEALAEGGTLAGLTLDDIDKMPASKLRAALRKEREQREREQEANAQLIAKKDATINDHERRHKLTPSFEDQEKQYIAEGCGAALKSNLALQELKSILGTIEELEHDHPLPEEHMRTIGNALSREIQEVTQLLEDVRAEHYARFAGYLGWLENNYETE